MADLFSVTAPLRIQVAKKNLYVIAECYPHPRGLVYLDLYWNELITTSNACIHLIEAELKGEGPWKIANNVIHVLGCHGTNAELAADHANWLDYCQVTNLEHSRTILNSTLLEIGVEQQYLHNSKIVYLDVNNSSK